MKFDHIDTVGYKPGSVVKVVPCIFCGTMTTMTGTKKCDDCWEINRRTLGWSLWRFFKFWLKQRRLS